MIEVILIVLILVAVISLVCLISLFLTELEWIPGHGYVLSFEKDDVGEYPKPVSFFRNN